jgi:hypothetical protein
MMSFIYGDSFFQINFFFLSLFVLVHIILDTVIATGDIHKNTRFRLLPCSFNPIFRLRMNVSNDCFARITVGIAVVVFLGCAYATIFVQDQIVSPQGAKCVGKSFYEVQKGKSAWNIRWKRFMYPPQSGDYGDVSCCAMNNAEQSSSWDKLPETCPSGCSSGTCSLGGCPKEYSQRAKRFNACMERVAEVSRCPPHVNDTGRMFAHYQRNSKGELDRFAADFDPNTNRRAVFLDIDDFLSDCEARIAFADQRLKYGGLLLVILLLPTIVWIGIIVEMVLCRKRYLSASRKKHEKYQETQEKAENAVDSAGDVELMENPMKVPAVITTDLKIENAAGKVIAISKIAAKKLEGNNSQWATCFKDWVQSAYFELLKFVFGVAVTLASQQASFLSPTNRYITEQQLLGNAIVVSSICTPVFFGLGLARARLLFDGAFAVFFASVAVQNLVGVFIDNEGPTGVVSYTPLSGTSLFNKSQAIVLPLFSFALAIRGQWLSSMKVHLLDDAKSEATRTAETAKNDDLEKKKSAQRRSTPYKVLFCLYGAGSYALGIYDASIVYGGYRCHELRTCARKRCDIASQPGMRLPFLNVKPSLLEKYGTFRPHQGNVENGESSFIFSYLMQSTQDASLPTGQAEWTVDQRSALKYTVDLVPGSKHDDGLPRVVLYVAEQSDQASTTRTVSSPSYNIGGKIKMRYGSSLKPCVSKFLVQCQELRPELAFEDKADPAEWVEYIDPSEGVFKLVLDTIDGVPDCWTADENKAGSAAGWWYDQLLFGPNITVGSTKSGEKILGFVMQNANFSSNSQQQGDPGQCIGGQQCGSAQSKSACNNIGAPCTWGAPNVNNLQRGMKFFSKVTYSIGYGRYSIFTDKWTSSDLDKHSMQKIPSQFMTTSYALDLKVPMLRWLECSDFETCSWSDPSQGGNNNNNGGNRPNSNNNGGPSNNNNGGNKPNPPPPGG